METVVSVQWAGGFTPVSDGGTGRRRVVPFNAGQDCVTVEQAVAIGEAQLALLGVRDSVQVEVEDVDVWPGIGDAVLAPGFDGPPEVQQIKALRLDADENGWARLVPTLGSAAEDFDARQALRLDALATGQGGGRSAGAAPSNLITSGVPTGTARKVTISPWSFSPPSVTDGPAWPVDEPTLVTALVCELTAATAGDITVEFVRTGVTATFFDIPEGDTRFTVLGALLAVPGDSLQVNVLDVGDNTDEDLEGVRLTVKPTAVSAAMRVNE